MLIDRGTVIVILVVCAAAVFFGNVVRFRFYWKGRRPRNLRVLHRGIFKEIRMQYTPIMPWADNPQVARRSMVVFKDKEVFTSGPVTCQQRTSNLIGRRAVLSVSGNEYYLDEATDEDDDEI